MTPSLPSGFSLVALDRVESTNDEAKILARTGAPHGTVVWARAQSKGRGRHGRRFQSPAGNLYVSVVLRPDCALQVAAEVSFLAALAVGEALSGWLPTEADVRYKWPNDVMVDGRKVSGILLESSSDSNGRLEWLIVGVGINVASFPAGLVPPATSLHASGGEGGTVEAVLEAFMARLAHWFAVWREKGFAPVREAWWRSAQGRGELLSVRRGDTVLRGRFESLDVDGALIVTAEDGQLHRINAGDVYFSSGG